VIKEKKEELNKEEEMLLNDNSMEEDID